MKQFELGQEIETTIVAITNDCIFLDLNSKSEGVLDCAELADENGNISVKEGDSIKVYFTGFKNGEMRFAAKIGGSGTDQTMIEAAFKNGTPVEGHVEKEVKGGFEVTVGGSRAFCPYSQMGFRKKEDSTFYIGKQLTFVIQEYKENGRNILVSNRAIKEVEYADQLSKLQQTLKEGMIVQGKIESLQKFGAFVDVSGFRALLPISEISRSRVEDIQSVLTEGQTVEAKIIKIDWNAEKVTLSMKSLLADPWDTVAKKYTVDSKHTGVISRIADFGLFVTLEPGIDGLVHVSELKNVDRNTNLRKVFKTGAELAVIIKSVDTLEHRISLTTATTNQEDVSAQTYLDNQDDSGTETYNPFAAMLKKR